MHIYSIGLGNKAFIKHNLINKKRRIREADRIYGIFNVYPVELLKE
jgi:hypothetical protein